MHIINYLGVTIIGKLVPVASIFLYSHFMSVQDYGVLNLAASYLWIFGIIMTLNLHTGVGRYIYTDHGDFVIFLGTTLIAITVIFVVCCVFVGIEIGNIELLMGLPRNVIVLVLILVVGSIAESIFTQIAIHGQKSSQLFRVVCSKALGTLALSISLLLLIEHDKYLAILYADALANVLLIIYVSLAFRSKVQFTFNLSHLAYMIKYSVPLIPYMLCLTLLSQFDRVMIDHFFGKEETGLYSLAYNVGIMLMMVVTALLNAFTPAFYDAIAKKDYSGLARDSKAIFALSVLVTSVLVLFGEEIFQLLVPAKYASALDLIPVVAIGGLSLVIFQIWVRVIAYANQTYLISIIAVSATGLKIGLNLLLLPIYGYKVAAVTTIAAYLLMSLSCVFVLNRVIRLFKVNILYELVYFGVLVVVMSLFRSLNFTLLVEYLLKVIFLVLIVLSLTPTFSASWQRGRQSIRLGNALTEIER